MCACKEPKPTKIHANFWIEGISGFHYVTCLEDIEKIYHGYAFFDELWSWIDSRGSGFRDINQLVTQILLNSRKRGYSIIYESKLVHMTDRRVRELTEFILEPSIVLNQNGFSETIIQDMLHPIDTKPYLDDLWIWVRKCVFNGDNLIEIENSDFYFRLMDVANRYNTREEVKALGRGEPTPGIEKGIKIEDAFSTQLRARYPEGEILRGANSRGWDVVVKANGHSCCFDVVSVRTENKYSRIDVRRKRIKELLQEAHRANLKPFWAFSLGGQWFSIPMVKEHEIITSISTNRGTRI
jgi:hypothetical protein